MMDRPQRCTWVYTQVYPFSYAWSGWSHNSAGWWPAKGFFFRICGIEIAFLHYFIEQIALTNNKKLYSNWNKYNVRNQQPQKINSVQLKGVYNLDK